MLRMINTALWGRNMAGVPVQQMRANYGQFGEKQGPALFFREAALFEQGPTLFFQNPVFFFGAGGRLICRPLHTCGMPPITAPPYTPKTR